MKKCDALHLPSYVRNVLDSAGVPEKLGLQFSQFGHEGLGVQVGRDFLTTPVTSMSLGGWRKSHDRTNKELKIAQMQIQDKGVNFLYDMRYQTIA
jgi:hypothetical protein